MIELISFRVSYESCEKDIAYFIESRLFII